MTRIEKLAAEEKQRRELWQERDTELGHLRGRVADQIKRQSLYSLTVKGPREGFFGTPAYELSVYSDSLHIENLSNGKSKLTYHEEVKLLRYLLEGV